MIDQQKICNTDPEVLFVDVLSNFSSLQENPHHQIIKAQKSHIIVNKQRPRILPLIIILFTGVLFLSLIVTAANAENITLSDTGTSLVPTLNVEGGGSRNSTGTVTFILFYDHNCHECQRVVGFLPGFLKENSDTSVVSYDIANNSEYYNLFQQYNDRFGKPFSPVPAIFVGEQELVGYEEITSGLGTGIAAARANGTTFPITPIPTIIAGNGSTIDKGLADKTYSINPLVLIVAAIGEGLNPCGLLVLALLLVSLMATGTRKMVLFVGIAYISAFFLVRLLSGFAIFSVIKLPGIAIAFTIVAGSIAIIAGVIQIKDGLSKEQKPLLSIPDSKKGLISNYMKKASIPGGFIVGVLVGIYGMACTAGIYISILGMLYKDLTHGLLYLIFYNFIVIIPLIAILLLVYFGLSPEKVNAWREDRKSLLRLIIGIIMVVMGIIILIPMI